MNLLLPELEAAAVTEAGYSDFGDAGYQAHAEALLRSLQGEAELTAQGAELTHAELRHLLVNRLQLQHFLFDYPEIRHQQISRPVFATGLPRSGTTFLQHLFDHNPSWQLLRTWETQAPSPPPGLAPQSIAGRIEKTRQTMARVWQQAVPGFDAIHLIDVEGPDECTQLLSNDFNQVGFFNYLNVPGYFDWICDHGDFAASYRYHKLQLQLLQWRRPRRRWVLKYPNHMLALAAIREVYPDCSFVFTHRDPVVTLASLCDLTLNFRAPRCGRQDPLQIGRQMLDFVARHVDAFMVFRETNPERVIDINYYELLADPLDQLQQLHLQLGEPLVAEASGALAGWLADNPQGARGEHSYRLQDFGLSREQVEPRFAAYRAAYRIPEEHA